MREVLFQRIAIYIFCNVINIAKNWEACKHSSLIGEHQILADIIAIVISYTDKREFIYLRLAITILPAVCMHVYWPENIQSKKAGTSYLLYQACMHGGTYIQ